MEMEKFTKLEFCRYSLSSYWFYSELFDYNIYVYCNITNDIKQYVHICQIASRVIKGRNKTQPDSVHTRFHEQLA